MFNKIKKLYNKKGKIDIVTGLRRSGTSMMMHALKESGVKIAGDKWASGGESDSGANPNGYWEVGKVTAEEGLNRKTALALNMGDVVKVMFECLPKSYPAMINKAVVMVREPRNVIYSFTYYNKLTNIDIFILNWTLDVIDSIEYLEEYQKEYIVVFYEDMLVNPEQEMQRVCEFIGKGDYIKGASVVDKKLDRSRGWNYPEIKYLETIYQYLRDGKIDNILAMRKKIDKRAYKLLK